MELTTGEPEKTKMPLPNLFTENDTLGRAYQAYIVSHDKGVFLASIVTALSELNPKLNTTGAAQADVEVWLQQNNIASSDEVIALRAEMLAKRAEMLDVEDERTRMANYLGMGQR